MRAIFFIGLLAISTVCASAELRTITEAWAYLKAPGASDQRVIIESKTNGHYVQCENMGTFLRCPFPIWAKVLPNVEQTAQTAARGTPFPEIKGSLLSEYIAPAEVVTLKKAIRERGLTPEDVYTSLADRKGQVAGSSYDVVVILEPSYTGFVSFVQYVLERVWGSSAKDGYKITKAS